MDNTLWHVTLPAGGSRKILNSTAGTGSWSRNTILKTSRPKGAAAEAESIRCRQGSAGQTGCLCNSSPNIRNSPPPSSTNRKNFTLIMRHRNARGCENAVFLLLRAKKFRSSPLRSTGCLCKVQPKLEPWAQIPARSRLIGTTRKQVLALYLSNVAGLCLHTQDRHP